MFAYTIRLQVLCSCAFAIPLGLLFFFGPVVFIGFNVFVFFFAVQWKIWKIVRFKDTCYHCILLHIMIYLICFETKSLPLLGSLGLLNFEETNDQLIPNICLLFFEDIPSIIIVMINQLTLGYFDPLSIITLTLSTISIIYNLISIIKDTIKIQSLNKQCFVIFVLILIIGASSTIPMLSIQDSGSVTRTKFH